MARSIVKKKETILVSDNNKVLGNTWWFASADKMGSGSTRTDEKYGTTKATTCSECKRND